jgi:hypothetical protein
MEKEQIEIKNTLIHILDLSLNEPVISENMFQPEDDIKKYLQKHITKMCSDSNLKKATFNPNSIVLKKCETLKNNILVFDKISTEITDMYFQILKQSLDTKSGDIIYFIFDKNNTLYFGMFKLGYKNSYNHEIQMDETGKTIVIKKNVDSLPTESQKIDEGFFINLNDFSIRLIEKSYTFGSEKVQYLSNKILDCIPSLSEKEKVDGILKFVNQFSKKHFDETSTEPLRISRAIAESVDETRTINVEKIAENVFRNNKDLKNEFVSEIRKTIEDEPEIVVSDKTAKRKPFKIQKLETDEGIEINLPFDIYGNIEKVEFVENGDGTTSILIKNVKVI